jgi:(p)ppGpp synthase/HD superfamily hydrolase
MNIERARQIAEIAHKKQTRKNGEPYINHCIRVSQRAKKYSSDAEIVGMLHDVIEDTTWCISDLQSRGFNEIIIEAIRAITHQYGYSYLKYILKLKKNDIAREVKICDLIDNLDGSKGTLRDKYVMAYYILTGDIYE